MARESEGRADAFLQRLAHLALGIFFRRIEVVGAERTPRTGPLVVVANHVNGLVDPALVAGCLPRMPRFLGKSTLWEYRLLRPLLDLAEVIPVYRRHDPGADPSRNVEAFAASWELLARGGALCLFPEGVSHSEPSLQPLKTGAARILLDAERRFGPLGTLILPVGLIYDAKQRFRSRVLVQVGDPIDPTPEVTVDRARAAESGGDSADPEAVQHLTERFDRALDELTLNYASWEEARRIALAANLYSRPDVALPSKDRMAKRFEVRRAFLRGYARMRRRHPERTAAVERSVAEYQRLLSALHLRDEQVAAAYPPASVLAFVGRMAAFLLAFLPVAAVGTVLNWLPYRVVGFLASLMRQPPDQQATWKIFPALLIYPALWLVEALLLWAWVPLRLGGCWLVAAVPLLAFLTGWPALRFHDARRRLQHEARAYLLLRTRKKRTAELKARRQRVLEEINGLVELYQSRGEEG